MKEGTGKEIALVYMVAGISSRFQGRIKQFAKVGRNQETLIECSLQQAIPAGFSKNNFHSRKTKQKRHSRKNSGIITKAFPFIMQRSFTMTMF
jgi:CTP:molybdopterin cytidylyltransferase MocA